MKKHIRRVCVVVTARPSYSRIKTALEAIVAHPDLQLQLVVAASGLLDRYGKVVEVIERDGFEIAARVYMVLEGENPISMAKTTGLGMLELSTVLDNLAPDVVVSIADRYETLATAVAASYMNIPLAHVQGGEVTGSIDEKVRHAVTKMADIHLVATRRAAERVVRMGEAPEMVFRTGCPSVDLAARAMNEAPLGPDIYERYGGVGPRPDIDHGYTVVLQHPVTTEHEVARQQVTETLTAVRELGLPALWFWPNVDAGGDGLSRGIRAFRELQQPENMHFFKNVEPNEFLRLLIGCRCLIGNSSVGIRECAYLGVPVVDIGSRQTGREHGKNVLHAEYDRTDIVRAVRQHLQNGTYPRDTLYGDGNAGQRMADVLATAPLCCSKRLTY
jgi:UDP-hydrolysing UDP-N-acetyl-D-glucosamine 2-epimerase